MNTQIFETAIEFVKGYSGVSTTSDSSMAMVILVAAVLLAAVGGLFLAFRMRYATAGAKGAHSASCPESKTFAAVIVLAILLILAAILPGTNAFAANLGRDVNATVPAKVTATVDADGSVTIASGKISNADDALAIGVRRVSVSSTAELGDASLKLFIDGTEVYSGPVDGELVIDDYATVAKGASADMAFELSVAADKALALIGTSPITIKTTVDAVSSPTGKILDIDGVSAGAEVKAIYTDPYTDKERTFTTQTDKDGIYTLDPMRYGTVGTIKVVDSKDYLATTVFTADNNQTVSDVKMPYYLKFRNAQDAESSVTPKFKSGTWQYSEDGGETWSDGTNDGTTTIALAKGDSVLLKGTNCVTSTDGRSDRAVSFSMTGSIAGSGSVTSLTDGNGADPSVTLAKYCYQCMFSGCTALAKAPELPATSLAERCYYSMFNGCTALAKAPELPATSLAERCYYSMFNGCTALTEAPALPAASLANNCYENMFNGCTALTEAPALKANSLADSCYSYMFSGCTALTEAPALNATSLAGYCYQYMFQKCTSLAKAPALPATTLTNGCYSNMFNGCTKLTEAPALNATTLTSLCYASMFFGCTSLRVSENGTGTKIFTCPSLSGYNPVNDMFKDTGGSFKGAPTAGNTYYWYTGSPE